MRSLSFYYDTSLTFSELIKEHDFLLRCVPPDLPEQRITEFTLTIVPMDRGGRYGTDAFGNRTYKGRIPAPHMSFRYTVRGRAGRDDSAKQREDTVLPGYKYPSRLTEPTDEMKDFLASRPLSGTALAKALAISTAVHEHFTYTPGATGVSTTAGEAFHQAKGVCQDYAHVFLSLCRLSGIPARYVSGLPEGDGVSHAWAEIWDDGYWYGVDPMRHVPVDEGYLKLSMGRDFTDCPIESGLFSGYTDQQQKVYMKVCQEQ